MALGAANLLLLSTCYRLKISDGCHTVRSLRVRIIATWLPFKATVLSSLQSISTCGERHLIWLSDCNLKLVSFFDQLFFLGIESIDLPAEILDLLPALSPFQEFDILRCGPIECQIKLFTAYL